jgi:hypothetical protein
VNFSRGPICHMMSVKVINFVNFRAVQEEDDGMIKTESEIKSATSNLEPGRGFVEPKLGLTKRVRVSTHLANLIKNVS